MKATGIEADSTVKGYEKQIVLTSLNHGVSLEMSQDASTGGRTKGRSNHGDISCTKGHDISSPKLALYSSNGTVITEVIITGIRQDGDDLIISFIITLKQVLVSSFSYGGGADGDLSDSFTLSYESITWHFDQQKADSGKGSQNETTWNVAKNAAK
jgi:type VI secretion system Hcp family effector